MGVLFTSATSLTWGPPADPGSTLFTYDVLRTPEQRIFGSNDATCVESDDGLDTMAIDATIPDPDSVFYYLIRAENACPDAAKGSLGSQSDNTPRTGRLCP